MKKQSPQNQLATLIVFFLCIGAVAYIVITQPDESDCDSSDYKCRLEAQQLYFDVRSVKRAPEQWTVETYKESTWDHKTARRYIKDDFAKITCKLYSLDRSIPIIITAMHGTVDDYGNEGEAPAAYMTIKPSTAAKINCKNLDYVDIADIADSFQFTHLID